MKNFCLILACVLMIVGISLPGFAAVDGLDASSVPEPVTSENLPGEDIPAEDEPVAADPNPEPDSDPLEVSEDDLDTGSSVYDDSGTSEIPVIEYSSQLVVRDAAEYSSDYSASLMGAIYAVFGEYTPRTYDVTTYLDDGTSVTSTEIVPGLAGLDYNWLAGVVLFTMVLFCILRMIGGMFRWK